MRIAAYNVENLFQRAHAMNIGDADALAAHAEINKILAKAAYTEADKQRIVELLKRLELGRKDDAGKLALLRQNRGRLLKRPKQGDPVVVAGGRGDWIGWVELKVDTVNELAIRHTAQVIADVDADVLGVIEAENRISLRDFSAVMLRQVSATPYPHVMVVDGNDGRGIDVGILTKSGYELVGMRSHVDDPDPGAQGEEVFSRDCIEHTIKTPGGKRLVMLVNHFKSKGYGKKTISDAKRKRQAQAVADIYRRLRSEGQKHIAVVGDLNDTPDSDPLSPLLAGTDLCDISEHPNYQSDGRPGTYANGTKSNKIDYVLLSPETFSKVTGGGSFRKGVWGGLHGTLFPHYPTMTKAVTRPQITPPSSPTCSSRSAGMIEPPAMTDN